MARLKVHVAYFGNGMGALLQEQYDISEICHPVPLRQC